jgi:hypothetical protein
VIFSRKSSGAKPRHAARRRTREEFGVPRAERGDASRKSGRDTGVGTVSKTTGPYDLADAPAGVNRFDLGSLRVPETAGVEIQVQAGPDGQVHQVVLICGASTLEVGVLAAPRTEGIWTEVRDDIKAQLAADGAPCEELDGVHGVELRCRVRTPDGPTDLRFVGIDGPRWMIQGVYRGPAVAAPDSAPPLRDCLRGLVVARGEEAMPVREPLALRLPKEVSDGMRTSTPAQSPDAPRRSARGGQ